MERRALSVLAAFGDRTSSVDTLIDVLWGARPPRSARKTLQTDVLRLRRLLGPDVITSVAGGYRLGAGIEVDVDRFEAAVAAARRSPDLDAWRDALAWWSGDPFVELAGWPAIEPRCASLHELCAVARRGVRRVARGERPGRCGRGARAPRGRGADEGGSLDAARENARRSRAATGRVCVPTTGHAERSPWSSASLPGPSSKRRTTPPSA